MEKCVRVVKLKENAVLPTRATPGSAGMDLCACMEESISLAPGQLAKVSTGIAVALPDENYVGLIFGRSGLGVKHGVTPSNSVGVIDSDYRGEICVGLCNVGSETYIIKPGERIAQLVIMPVCPLPVRQVEILDETARGTGGFGSTGK